MDDVPSSAERRKLERRAAKIRAGLNMVPVPPHVGTEHIAIVDEKYFALCERWRAQDVFNLWRRPDLMDQIDEAIGDHPSSVPLVIVLGPWFVLDWLKIVTLSPGGCA
jgi:hypothetical protein